MKKCFVLLILLAPVFVYSKNGKKKIEALEKKRYQLMIAADTNQLSSMLANSLEYYHSNGMLDTKQSFLQSIATKVLVHKNITVTKQNIRVYKKRTAIVTGTAIYDINYQGQDMSLTMVFTNVYVKIKDVWILVNRQTTKEG